MPPNEFDAEETTAPILVLTEEELAWAEVARRQRAKTRDMREVK